MDREKIKPSDNLRELIPTFEFSDNSEKLNLSDFERILNKTFKEFSVVSNGGSGNASFILTDKNERQSFLKYRTHESIPWNSQRDKIFEDYEKDSISWIYRRKNGSWFCKELFSREATVLENWNQIGLPSPQLIQSDYSNYLLLEFFPQAETVASMISRDRSPRLINGLLDTLKQYREFANGTKNMDNIHMDLHLENILYDLPSDSFKFIDPGVLVKKDLSVAEVDAYANLFFCYTVLSNYFLGESVPQNTRQTIVSNYVDMLPNGMKNLMQGLNKPTPQYVMDFFSELKWDQKIQWHNSFSKDKFDLVQHYLK